MEGHQERSWAPNSDYKWAESPLVKMVPGARLMSFGYDAHIRNQALLSKTNIFDIGHSLLGELARKRQREQVKKDLGVSWHEG